MLKHRRSAGACIGLRQSWKHLCQFCQLDLQGVMGLSEEQIEDHMCLRRLCVTKRGLLAMERKALIDHMAKLDCFNKDAPATVTQLSDLAARLRENAAKDYKVYLRLACASRRGVRSACLLSAIYSYKQDW